VNFFIKKLNSHELGYRNGVPGGAGQYILIPKHALTFFPNLSRTILNDEAELLINDIPLKYVYHNSKFASRNPDENRDEYRLYINSEIKGFKTPFLPDDIILLRQLERGYRMLYVSTTNSLYYNALALLNNPPSKTVKLLPDVYLSALANIAGEYKAAALFDPSIVFRDFWLKSDLILVHNPPLNPSVRTTLTELELEEALSKNLIEYKVLRRQHGSSRIERDKSFRRVVLSLYNFKCAISEGHNTFEYGYLINLEAAHIVPKENGGGDHPSNGISLTRDLHWAFDNGFFTIDNEYKIMVHPAIMETSSPLNEIHGQSILIPENELARPDKGALQWRKENIFGKFLILK
jgi:HNH endonuclease